MADLGMAQMPGLSRVGVILEMVTETIHQQFGGGQGSQAGHDDAIDDMYNKINPLSQQMNNIARGVNTSLGPLEGFVSTTRV